MTITGAKIISDGQILTGYDVICHNGYIDSVEKHAAHVSNEVALDGMYLAPGFIDLHCHGGGGYEFIDCTDEAFRKIADVHYAHGTRVLYPTLSASDTETTVRFLEKARKLRNEFKLITPGVHLEGPYFSPAMCGAQDTTYIKAPDSSEYLPILQNYADVISRWSYAPERDDGSFQRALNRFGVVGSMGHTAAEYTDVERALGYGCSLITHLYSCTSTITRHGGFRHLGVIECAYLFDELYAEAIGDGCHIPPELMRLIVKGKGPEHICLITDAIRFACMDSAESLEGGTERIPYVIEDGVAKLADRSAFAGSIASTDTILKRTVAAGISLEDTVTMLTSTPAKAIGLEKFGHIKPGYRAVFTAFDERLNVFTCDKLEQMQL